MAIKIDEEKCIGCGTCVAVAPETFAMEGDKAKVISGQDTVDSNAQLAIDSCPTQAISKE